MASPASFPRVIAHLDMDAFYASVELLRYPELRGQPVVIGGGSRHQPVWETDRRRRRAAASRGSATTPGRGVITTATYEARAFGVHSAMGMMKAAAKAPDAVLLPVDFDEYRKYSRLFKAAVRALAPQVEDRGIDEIYIDLTDVIAARLGPDVDPVEANAEAWWCARDIGRELKQAVRDATGLGCSIGLAPNKLVAKIASELDKPDGLTVVTEHDVATRLRRCRCARLNGVGPKSAAKLARLGIATIGELADSDPAWLRQHFGVSYGAWLVAAARGEDDRPVVTRERAEVDQPRDHLRTRPACRARPAAAVGDLHRAVRRRFVRPAAQALRRPDHRHQAALRRLPDGDARPDDRGADRRCRHDPPRRR